MNVANLAFHALQRATNPTTVADVCRLYKGGHHTRQVLENLFDIPPETEIHRALARLKNLADAQRSIKGKGYYDPNRLIGLVSCHQMLSTALANAEAQS